MTRHNCSFSSDDIMCHVSRNGKGRQCSVKLFNIRNVYIPRILKFTHAYNWIEKTYEISYVKVKLSSDDKLRFKPPVVIYYYWPCQGGTLIFTFILCMSCVYFERVDVWLTVCVCLYVYECALLERWVYFLYSVPALVFSYLIILW